MKRKTGWKKTGKWLLRLLLMLFIALCLVEWMYRGQWFDFYRKEWSFQNGEANPDLTRKRILVLGDSFSADPKSWVNCWKRDSSIQVLNGAIPGTGPETFRLILSRRLEQSRAQVLIVQLYEGNDLIDIRKPVNWRVHSFWRNAYWWAGNTFRSLNFINYRLGQSAGDVQSLNDPKADEDFSPEDYSPRTMLYISGDSRYPVSHLRLQGEQRAVFGELCAMLNEMRQEAGSTVRFVVLPVPHCTQTSEIYGDRYRQLGAKVSGIVRFGHPWARALEKAGFEVWDPLPEFRSEEKKGNRLYYANDPHLNDKGQQVLLKFVRKQWKKHVS